MKGSCNVCVWGGGKVRGGGGGAMKSKPVASEVAVEVELGIVSRTAREDAEEKRGIHAFGLLTHSHTHTCAESNPISTDTATATDT